MSYKYININIWFKIKYGALKGSFIISTGVEIPEDRNKMYNIFS